MDGVEDDDDFEFVFTPSYHLEWEVGDRVVFEPEKKRSRVSEAAALFWLPIFAVSYLVAKWLRDWFHL